MAEPEPLEEAKEGAWLGAELLALTGVAFVGACLIFPPTRLLHLFFSRSLDDPVKDGLPWFILRGVLFLALLVGATGLLALERHRKRRARTKAASPPPGVTLAARWRRG